MCMCICVAVSESERDFHFSCWVCAVCSLCLVGKAFGWPFSTLETLHSGSILLSNKRLYILKLWVIFFLLLEYQVPATEYLWLNCCICIFSTKKKNITIETIEQQKFSNKTERKKKSIGFSHQFLNQTFYQKLELCATWIHCSIRIQFAHMKYTFTSFSIHTIQFIILTSIQACLHYFIDIFRAIILRLYVILTFQSCIQLVNSMLSQCKNV